MNEPDNREDSTSTQSLTDLSVSPEQAEQTKAGVVSSGIGVGKFNVHDMS